MTHPAMHESARTSFFASAFTDRDPLKWRFTSVKIEFEGPYMYLCFYDAITPTRLFIAKDGTADFIGLLRESHARTSEHEVLTMLHRPQHWKDGDRWQRFAQDGVCLELLAFCQGVSEEGVVAILTREERAALIAEYERLNPPPPVTEPIPESQGSDPATGSDPS